MTSNIPTPVIDLKPFVPAKNFALSQQFYADLGFHTQWADEKTAELRLGSFGFLLQNYYVEQYAGNFMMHLMVEDGDVWWQHIEAVGFRGKYPGIMMKAPTLQPWGLRVLYLSDPSGVLWHIADRRSQAPNYNVFGFTGQQLVGRKTSRRAKQLVAFDTKADRSTFDAMVPIIKGSGWIEAQRAYQIKQFGDDAGFGFWWEPYNSAFVIVYAEFKEGIRFVRWVASGHATLVVRTSELDSLQ